MLVAVIALTIEAWLLFTPDLSIEGKTFSLLCALSCWVPAWLCADLLSIHHRKATELHREWAPREFLARARARLRGYFPLMALWAGTWTARALAAEGAGQPKALVTLAGDPGWLPYTWLAWTTVFLASAVAYAAGAALFSASCRRPRRWLLVPMLVVGLSICGALAMEVLLPAKAGGVGGMIVDPLQNGSVLLAGPNYLLGATVALSIGGRIDGLPDAIREPLGFVLGQGIAPFSWIATVFFLIGTAGAITSPWAIARRRHLRHPNTTFAGGIP
ncbi:MAG: hypothetical protein K0Q72_4042, partial [Armatimonadetes bacterium]|nr:hypothetical protein [Armatimonadota bacterium]